MELIHKGDIDTTDNIFEYVNNTVIEPMKNKKKTNMKTGLYKGRNGNINRMKMNVMMI